MKKTVFYTEIAYFVGLALLAFGTALTAYGNLGISMVVAPAYILHLFLSQFFPFFSFGIAEYFVQALILILIALIMRKAKLTYLLSFGAIVFYGICLDASMKLTALFDVEIYLQIPLYCIGATLCCGSIALLFHSYLPPEAYELFSKEISAKYQKPIHRIVNFFNMGCLLLSIVLSLVFFGKLQGLGSGTVTCAFFYGFVIRFFQKVYEKLFCFKDRFPLREKFG